MIARFQEFFNQILCNSNGLLAPPDIDFIQYHQSLIVDIDHSYPEIYYDFEHSDRAGYSLFFTERNSPEDNTMISNIYNAMKNGEWGKFYDHSKNHTLEETIKKLTSEEMLV